LEFRRVLFRSLYAGIGAGWYEHEWRAYGYQWPELRDRMGSFSEAVEIIHRMWTEDDVVFRGKYYSVDKPINEPKGVRKPHPPLWIGGGGERVTLKLVAKYGDACNVGAGKPEVIKRKLEVLREHCDAVGRDFDQIIKSTNIMLEPGESTGEILARVEGAVNAGADYVIVYIPRVAYDHEPLHRFAAEVIPQFAG